MSILDYIKPVDTITAQEAKDKIKGLKPKDYCLLDVRQLKEYEETHLPGAVLIPISQLRDRLTELDPDKLTIVYCAIGGRSRAGATILSGEGFREVYNLKGGTKAWDGYFVPGPPETGMPYFKKAKGPEDILTLAWALEEGAKCFYEKMAQTTEDPEAKEWFATLYKAEIGHQSSIDNLYFENVVLPDGGSMILRDHLSPDETELIMEGQLKVSEVLAWAQNSSLKDILAYCMGLEASVYDLYSRLAAQYDKTSPTHKIYDELAKEEKRHLDRFTELLEKKI
jgi:sulfur-carrier protein adenylyltransferase/sulfurtransferase